ncbi:phage head-tail connector protein [Lacticaseibacillus mingshuiensis]|uniref:phage head-tail connector protein n=1 Tax=Lacticaseibacillus mingshuiensis TaxID=2799574 RepID=UPI001951DABA|nr:phage head-tail connector protein [Lacticaseibacillus mingshuiensis]
MAILDDVKTLIGLTDNSQDDLINLIVTNTTASLRLKLHLPAADQIPDALSYIVSEVSVRRWNRRTNEGLTAYGQEGLSLTFVTNDFDDFQADIDLWLADNQPKDQKTLGKVSFINGYGGGSHAL